MKRFYKCIKPWTGIKESIVGKIYDTTITPDFSSFSWEQIEKHREFKELFEEVNELPKYFVIKRDLKNPLWFKYIEWINHKKKNSTLWKGIDFMYYGFDGSNKKHDGGFNYSSYISYFHNNPIEITLECWDYFTNQTKEEQFVLPKKWCIKRDKNNYKIINDYFNMNINGYYGLDDCDNYLHCPLYDGWNTGIIKEENYIEITYEQFQKYVLNQENKQQVMEQQQPIQTQKLNRKQLISLYDKYLCHAWRDTIMKYIDKLKLSSDNDYVFIDQKDIERAIKEANDSQKQSLRNCGIILEEDKSIDLTSYGCNNTNLSDSCNNKPSVNIQIRSESNFANKAFYLSGNYNWEIKTDKQGLLCLIPTKK